MDAIKLTAVRALSPSACIAGPRSARALIDGKRLKPRKLRVSAIPLNAPEEPACRTPMEAHPRSEIAISDRLAALRRIDEDWPRSSSSSKVQFRIHKISLSIEEINRIVADLLITWPFATRQRCEVPPPVL